MAILNTSGYTSALFGLMSTFIFWAVVLLFLVVTIIGGLWVRKKRKLVHPVIETVPLGRGKIGIRRRLKGGWFKNNKTFFGLWDYGERDIYLTSDGRQIQNLSSEDFHEIDGKMGVIAVRSPENPRILLPLNKAEIENKTILLKIPPGDYVGAVIDVIKKSERETRDRTQEIVKYALLGLIIMIFFISIIIVSNMNAKAVDGAKEIVKEAETISQDKLELLCKGMNKVGKTIPSTKAP